MIAIWKARRRKIFAALLTAAMGQALAAAAAAWCVRHLFNQLIGSSEAGGHASHLLGIGFFLAALFGFLLEVVQRRLGEEMALDYTAEVRLALFDHHLKLPPERFGHRSQGALLLPFVGDLTALKQWVGNGLARIFAAAVTLTVLLGILAGHSLLLGAAIGAALAVGGLVMLSLGRPLNSAVRDLRRRRGALAGFVSGRLSGVAAIQMMARARSERRKVVARTESLNRASRRRAWITGTMRGAAQFTGSLLIIATLLAGTHEIAAGRLTPGALVATLSLVGLMAAAMHDLGRGLESWYPARISRERIAAVLRQPARRRMKHRAGQEAALPGLTFESLAIGPLSGLSTTVRPGEVVLIEGPAGSGKSSLLGCIAQLTQQTTGAIMQDGRDLRSLTPAELRRTIGFASPALPLLRGSFGMNLRYRKPDVAAEDVTSLLASSGLDRLVAHLPGGLRARLTDNGVNLSFGERQALLLARAILGLPPILLIDSIDSHLDPPVVRWLADTLRSYPGTVLMAVSRPELARCATRVWRLDQGIFSEQAASPASLSLIPLPPSAARGKSTGSNT